MGMLNLFSKNVDDRPAIAPGRVKGPCAILLEHGIDPAELKFTLDEDGFVTVSGRARNQSECDRICQAIAEMPLIAGIKSNLIIAGSRPAAGSGTGNAGDSDAGTSAEGQGAPMGQSDDSDTLQANKIVFKQAG